MITRYNGSREVSVPDESGTAETTQTVYDFEDLVIDYRPAWLLAQDPKTGQILNGAFFQYA